MHTGIQMQYIHHMCRGTLKTYRYYSSELHVKTLIYESDSLGVNRTLPADPSQHKVLVMLECEACSCQSSNMLHRCNQISQRENASD